MEIKIIKIALYFAYITTIVTGKSYLVETSGDTVKDHKTHKDAKATATAAAAADTTEAADATDAADTTDTAEAARDETAATSATDATKAAPPSNDYKLGLFMSGTDFWNPEVINAYPQRYGNWWG